jgi:predicted oxidoreductase
MEPEQVAEAFDTLKKSGKVKEFGVSNQDPMTIELLQRSLNQRLVANQLQLSITNARLISPPLNINNETEQALDHDNGTLNYCRLNNITIQAWSPFQYGLFEGVFLDNPKFLKLNKVLGEMAEKYNTSKSSIVVAWILRHPAQIQVVTGTMNAEHLKEATRAVNIKLSHDDWYEIYLAAGHILP